MININNRRILQKVNPIICNLFDKQQDKKVIVKETAKSGQPTLKVLYNGEFIYVSSKYNPEREAENFVNQLEVNNNVKHILFIGTGLGYHIKRILKEQNNIEYSIYEPNINILKSFLTEVDLSLYKNNKLVNIFSEIDQLTNIELFLRKIKNSNQTIILPVTQKIYQAEVTQLLEKILSYVKVENINTYTNIVYQQRWIYNSIKNFPNLIKTPNIFLDINKTSFKGKPVVLVSAGPSLSFEYDNLRYIKEKGLAYIVSVGSAINSLIEQDILPDFACTYDPSEKNQYVFEKLKTKRIKDVPLIFGSSVGYETIQNYPGPLVHMITSQDTISANLLDTTKNIDIVLDAPSIAIVTFQMLVKLQVEKIILVGQNLAFLDNKRYADGIQYEFISNELNESEKESIIQIESVDGEIVGTSEGFLSMKNNLELFIKTNPNITVYNTTRYGAKIEGTKYLPLQELIKTQLIIENNIDKNWYDSTSSYDPLFIISQLNKMNCDYKELPNAIETANGVLNEIKDTLDRNKLKKLEVLYAKFDTEFLTLKNNLFYTAIIEPMIRVQNKLLSEESVDIKYEQNVRKKATLVIESFGRFLDAIKDNYEFATPFFKELRDILENEVSIDE